MVSIVDYGCGNINAIVNTYKRLNTATKVVSKKSHLDNVKKIILPGVGAFDYVMQSLNESGLRSTIEKKVLQEKIPVLGICAGMQILGKSSEEGKMKGLGWIDGEIKRFDESKIYFATKLPHMGWNSIEILKNRLFQGIKNNSRFYFVHSYYFENEYTVDSIARTDYGIQFTSAINKENIYGVQFHPEKSHQNGQKLLNNFAKL